MDWIGGWYFWGVIVWLECWCCDVGWGFLGVWNCCWEVNVCSGNLFFCCCVILGCCFCGKFWLGCIGGWGVLFNCGNFWMSFVWLYDGNFWGLLGICICLIVKGERGWWFVGFWLLEFWVGDCGLEVCWVIEGYWLGVCWFRGFWLGSWWLWGWWFGGWGIW